MRSRPRRRRAWPRRVSVTCCDRRLPMESLSKSFRNVRVPNAVLGEHSHGCLRCHNGHKPTCAVRSLRRKRFRNRARSTRPGVLPPFRATVSGGRQGRRCHDGDDRRRSDRRTAGACRRAGRCARWASREVRITGGFWAQRQAGQRHRDDRARRAWLDRLGWTGNFARRGGHGGIAATAAAASSPTPRSTSCVEAMCWEVGRTGDTGLRRADRRADRD